MKVQICVDGVKYPLKMNLPRKWKDCVNCEDCFLNSAYCDDLCMRVYQEQKKRAEQANTEEGGGNGDDNN